MRKATEWIIYRITKDGKSEILMTDQPVDTLATFLRDSTIEIIYKSTIKSYATNVLSKELKEAHINNLDKRQKYHDMRKRFSEVGKKYGPINGKKVGTASIGMLKTLRETKVLCPDGHTSNLVFYKFYCNRRGLRIEDCQVLK